MVAGNKKTIRTELTFIKGIFDYAPKQSKDKMKNFFLFPVRP